MKLEGSVTALELRTVGSVVEVRSCVGRSGQRSDIDGRRAAGDGGLWQGFGGWSTWRTCAQAGVDWASKALASARPNPSKHGRSGHAQWLVESGDGSGSALGGPGKGASRSRSGAGGGVNGLGGVFRCGAGGAARGNVGKRESAGRSCDGVSIAQRTRRCQCAPARCYQRAPARRDQRAPLEPRSGGAFESGRRPRRRFVV
jgi:hypothetical protein